MSISYSDLNTVIREDEGCVGSCKLGVRHFDLYGFELEDLNEMPFAFQIGKRRTSSQLCLDGGRASRKKLPMSSRQCYVKAWRTHLR